MTHHLPQIIFVALLAASLGVSVRRGDDRRAILEHVAATVVALVLLTWGGFFG